MLGSNATNAEHCEYLGIPADKYTGMTDYQKYYQVRVHFKKTLFRYATDKDFRDTKSQDQIQASRVALLHGNSYVPVVAAKYLASQAATEKFDSSPLSLMMVNQLFDRAYAIQEKINQVEDEEQKRRLQDHYQTFIDVAEVFDMRFSSDLNKAVSAHNQYHWNYLTIWKDRYHYFMIKMFGDANTLNDYDIREMLAFGIDWEKLSSTQRYNPVKLSAHLIFLVTNTLISAIHALLYRFVYYLSRPFITLEDGTSKSGTGVFLLAVGAAILSLMFIDIIAPLLILIGIVYGALVGIETYSRYIASPVTSLLQPFKNVVEKLPVDTYMLKAGILALLVTTLSTILLSPTFFTWLSGVLLNALAMAIVVGIPLTELTQSINDKAPGLGYLMSILLCIYLSIVQPSLFWVTSDVLFNATQFISTSVVIFCMTKLFQALICTFPFEHQIMLTSPYPEQAVDPDIKESIMIGFEAKSLTFEFFGSPKPEDPKEFDLTSQATMLV